MASETLELKFLGGDVIPKNISSTELADIIKSFETAIAHVILKEHRELSTENIVISLVDIGEGSVRLNFLPKLKNEAVAAFVVLTTAIQENNYSSLPVKSVESLQTISGFCKKRKCASEFRIWAPVSEKDIAVSTEKPLAVIDAETSIEITDDLFLIGETVIYGEVIRVGGADPKVSLRITDNGHDILYCSISREIAKKIGKDVYEEVGLRGVAKWEKGTYRLVDFKVEDVIGFKRSSIAEGINEISKTFGKYWKNVDDVVGEISKLRGSLT